MPRKKKYNKVRRWVKRLLITIWVLLLLGVSTYLVNFFGNQQQTTIIQLEDAQLEVLKTEEKKASEGENPEPRKKVYYLDEELMGKP